METSDKEGRNNENGKNSNDKQKSSEMSHTKGTSRIKEGQKKMGTMKQQCQ